MAELANRLQQTVGDTYRIEGRYDDAIAEVRALEAEQEAPTPEFVRALLSRIYDRAGNADSALRYYERYVETPWLFRLNTDSEDLWRALKRLGELYEARGNRERALAYYGRFVELWRDADPDLQSTVEVVRARMERLAAEGG